MQLDLYAVCRERYLHKCHEPSSAIRTYATSAIGKDFVSGHKLSYTGRKRCSDRYREQFWKTVESYMVSQDSRMHCKVQMNKRPLTLWPFNCILTKGWYEAHHSHQWRF